MNSKWLNFYLHFVSFNFRLKQKMIQAKSWVNLVPLVIVFIFSELFLAIISIPLYFIVPPQKVQEKGFIFPVKDEAPKDHFENYIVRRKISLFAIFASIGVVAFKMIFAMAVSLYFIGAQTLLAATQSWDFNTAGDYTYDSAKIDVTGGVAKLHGTDTVDSGATTNPDFTSNDTGWTYADWDQGGGEANVAGSRQTSGGNPTGWARIRVPVGTGDQLGGYYYQGFTTTVANPTTTVSFDWQVSDYDSTPNPITFKAYVFVDTGTGVPVIGQQVWASSEITSTSGWASISNLDVSSKVTGIGTYYLKVALWIETAATSGGPYSVGYDNIQLDWTKSTTTYDTGKPTINPVAALNAVGVTSYNSFFETATKNGGEIYYQLSDDDGATYKYWNGSAWVTAAPTNYNTASVVNTNIDSFPITASGIKWKAFLESDGSQEVILSDLDITYTQNVAPTVQNLVVAQNTTSGYVHVNYNLLDDNSDPSDLINFEYSLTGAFAGEELAMTAASGDPAHSGISGLTSSPAGVAHTFVWDAQTDLGSIYSSSVYVRLRANDGISDSNFATSTATTVDYVDSVVSNVTAAQIVDTNNVQIGYDLADDTADNILVELQISSDGGGTWVVPAVSVSGDVGSGITAGTGKVITWDSEIDFPDQNVANMMVQVRAKDKYQNQGAYVPSATFALDNTTPALPIVNVPADILAQPVAGATTVSVGGSFTTDIPNTNDFYVALNGGAYGAATVGDTDTATPSDQNVDVGTTLKGNDYISAVKIVHTDDISQTVDNENTSPNVAYKYVRPYTPAAPTVGNPTATSLDVTINKNAAEVDGLEYAIFETTFAQYVQANGTFGGSEAWMAASTITVNGLSDPVSQYAFQVKSRNTSDGAHAVSSESDLSSTASFGYQAPNIVINSVAQTTDGTKYVVINYTGIDYLNHPNDFVTYEYSVNGIDWNVMTEKSGVGSSGISGLAFSASGAALMFAWDVGSDLPNTEDSNVFVRLQSTDDTSTSNIADSSDFVVDTAGPVVSGVTAVQTPATESVAISYDLTDSAGSNNTVELLISDDSGVSYDVVAPSVSGDVGAGVNAGAGKSITWNVGADLANSESGTMRLKIRSTDSFNNLGNFTESADFSVDTKAPVVNGVTAVQAPGSALVTVNYTLSDLNSSTVEFDVSDDSGATWTVTNDTFSGDMGAGQTAGAKSFTWNAATDFPEQELSTMQVRVRASDSFAHQGGYEMSADFSINTKVLSISNIVAVQDTGAETFTITYDLNKDAEIEVGISADSGVTWTVPTTTLAGDVGAGITTGNDKTITWDAGTDFNDQEVSTMRVRIRGTDISNVVSPYYESADFALDTLPASVEPPVVPPVVEPPAAPSGGGGGGVFLRKEKEPTLKPIELEAPIVLTPKNNGRTIEPMPILVGIAAPGLLLEITLDGENEFTVRVNSYGGWRFAVPSSFALEDGTHTFVLKVVDGLGNTSPEVTLALRKVPPAEVTPEPVVPVVEVPEVVVPEPVVPTEITEVVTPIIEVPEVVTPVVPVTPVTEIPEIPAPVVTEPITLIPRALPKLISRVAPEVAAPVSIVRENITAVEKPGIPTPLVASIAASTANDVFTFTGTTLPDQDVVVYLHSTQAIMYRTHSDNEGVWRVDHSQDTLELAPGEHTVFAVLVDPVANIKSLPGQVSVFTVNTNFWVMIFNYLNLQTTLITIFVLLIVFFWLYRIRNRREVGYNS